MAKLTDNQDELFDIVDKNDNVVGQARREVVHHNKNLIHRSIGVCVFNDKDEIYLQKRSTSKDTDPGKWTISCSGHVLSGDSYEETVFRELKEELGLNLIKSPISLVAQSNGQKERAAREDFFASLTSDYQADPRRRGTPFPHFNCSVREAYKNLQGQKLKDKFIQIDLVAKYICHSPNETEIQMLFKVYSDGPFVLHPQEIEEGMFYTQKELKEALRKKKIELSFMGKVALEKIGWQVNTNIQMNEQ